ncbi:MAG: hypothetical protein ACKVRN_08645 [Pyrinomonadaceae bacterium]
MSQIRHAFLVLTCFFCAFGVYGQAFSAAGQGNSQILLAHKAKSIVIGEVLHVGQPSEGHFSTIPIGSQTVVFKIHKSLRGVLKKEGLIRVAVEVSLSKAGNLALFFAEGQNYVILLNEKSDLGCGDEIFDKKTHRHQTKPEFFKYQRAPCFPLEPRSIIDANREEIEAIQLFAE